ncbi:hypothetical protein [Poriferisphaera sp. WC338]|uniref:hypothetical protein n=1 Tax=Poriferisphaera sp. WC338 TaxID=3425129 RepID=UPI003D8194F2
MPQYWFEIGRRAQIADQYFHNQPSHQQLMSRVGYPGFNPIGFDQQQYVSGDHSLGVRIKDGSAGAFLQVGAIPAVPNSDYLITVNVRTDAIERAHAQVTTYFIDARGEQIAGSIQHSEVLRTKGEWTLVKLKLVGDHKGAAWIGMELTLKQPTQTDGHPLGKHQIVLEDIAGQAWFDDIGVWQMPHIQVATQSAVNMIREPNTPRLEMQIRDLTGHRLIADVRVMDHRLKLVDHQQRVVGSGMPKSWVWQPKLDRLGWYLVEMNIFEQRSYVPGEENMPVARTLGAFSWLPKEPATIETDMGRFALIADHVTEKQMKLLPELMQQADLQLMSLSMWDEGLTLENLAGRYTLIEQMLSDFAAQNGKLILSLDPLPKVLSQSEEIEAKLPLELLQKPEAIWRPYLAPMMMRLGQRISGWQVGGSDSPDAFYYRDLPSVLKDVERKLRSLAPQPNMVVPWRIDMKRPAEMDVKGDVTYLIQVADWVGPAEMTSYLQDWNQDETQYWLYYPLLDAKQFRHEQRVADLAKRMLYGWSERAGVLAIRRPWTRAAERREAVLPDPSLGVFSHLAHRLVNRKVVGQLPLQPGLKCLIFDGPAGGMLAVWNESAAEEYETLNLYLGEKPVAIDVWGNREIVEVRGGKHRLRVTRTPILIEGIDTELALFRASFKIDPPFIESKQTLHPRTITLKNPWNRTISGYMQIRGPAGWQATPVRHFFSIAAKQSATLPVQLRFPLSEIAGEKLLEANFKFTADEDYVVDMTAPMELGLEGIEYSATLSLRPGKTPGTTDAVLVCLLTNTGVEPITMYAFANVYQRRRQELPVPKMEPGETLMRRFYFEDVGELIKKYPVRAGVREVDGPAVLNQMIRYQSQ